MQRTFVGKVNGGKKMYYNWITIQDFLVLGSLCSGRTVRTSSSFGTFLNQRKLGFLP